MDFSIKELNNNVQLAQMQREAIQPLLKNARLVLLNSAIPQADKTSETQQEADEAAASLAQAILFLDHNLRKIIDKEKVLEQAR